MCLLFSSALWAVPFEEVKKHHGSLPTFEAQYSYLLSVQQPSSLWKNEQQGEYFLWLGIAAGELSKLVLAEEYFARAIQILKTLPPSTILVKSLLERSFFRYLDTGNANYYCPDRYEALGFARQLNEGQYLTPKHAQSLVQALSQTSFCASSTKNFAVGLAMLQEALRLIEKYPTPPSQKAMVYNASGNIYRANGLHQKAYAYLTQAYNEWESVNDYQDMFNMLHSLTSEAISLHKLEEAQHHVNEQFAMADAPYAASDFLFFAHINQGLVHQAHEAPEKAYLSFEKALALQHTTVERAFVNELRFKMAIAAWQMKDAESTLRHVKAFNPELTTKLNEGYISDAMTNLLSSGDSSTSVIDQLLALNSYHETRLKDVIDGQISIVAHDYDDTVAKMESEMLKRKLAISELELKNRQSEEINRTLISYLMFTVVVFLIILAIVLAKGRNRYKAIANVDYLTGVQNRRAAFSLGNKLLAQAKVSKQSFSIMMLDIDHFKAINDTHGHDVGDTALKGVVDQCQHILRKYDVIARIGGEEFLLLLPESTENDALDIAKRLIESIEKMTISYADKSIKLTVSIGVAAANQHATFEALVRQADSALYKAKDAGRNRVDTV